MHEEDGGGFDPTGELMTLSLDSQERGNSFALPRATYRSLSSAALACVEREIMTIRKLRDGSPGAILEIYGSNILVTVFVDGTVSVFEQDLDCCVAVESLSISDDSGGWRQVRETMQRILGRNE